MAWNDSFQMKQLLGHSFFDKEEPINKWIPNQKPVRSCPSPEALHNAAVPRTGTDNPHQTEEDNRPAETSCCELEDLRRIPQCRKDLTLLQFSPKHKILIDVKVFKREGGGIVPHRGKQTWTRNVVKLPCSPSSVIYTGSSTKTRWSMISQPLKKLVEKNSVNDDDVKKAILKYNPKYKALWSFDTLKEFVKSAKMEKMDLSALFQKIAALALKLPEYVMKDIPLLQRGNAASITLSQVQISCLLANAFYCTFPHRNATRSRSRYHNYPTINFSRLFGDCSMQKIEKLKAIMHYFQVVTNDRIKLDGLVTFERRCLVDTNVQSWKSCKEKMNKLYVSSYGTIDTEGTGLLQVDFANSSLGGGILSSGLVQEEILFLMHPELIVSRLFTEKLRDDESVIVTGVQQFGTYSGFSHTFKWEGPYEDHTRRDRWARRQRQILAIDALDFNHIWEQYNMRVVTRELNKAYCGFKGQEEEPDIATGKWGCGAFHGEPQLKALIQLMAAAKAKRGLAFFTFSDKELERGLKQTYSLLRTKGTTVAELFDLLVDYCCIQHASGTFNVDLFDYIRTHLPSLEKQSLL